MTRFAGPSSPSDAVDVRFAVRREVEVEHNVDGGDVEAARCNVRGDEDLAGAGAEFTQRAQASGLTQLAVEGNSTKSEGAEQDG